MIVHEIVAIRKGGSLGRRLVELEMREYEWEEDSGAQLKGKLEVEGTTDALDEVLGAGYDVGDKVELSTLQFMPIPKGDEE